MDQSKAQTDGSGSSDGLGSIQDCADSRGRRPGPGSARNPLLSLRVLDSEADPRVHVPASARSPNASKQKSEEAEERRSTRE